MTNTHADLSNVRHCSGLTTAINGERVGLFSLKTADRIIK